MCAVGPDELVAYGVLDNSATGGPAGSLFKVTLPPANTIGGTGFATPHTLIGSGVHSTTAAMQILANQPNYVVLSKDTGIWVCDITSNGAPTLVMSAAAFNSFTGSAPAWAGDYAAMCDGGGNQVWFSSRAATNTKVFSLDIITGQLGVLWAPGHFVGAIARCAGNGALYVASYASSFSLIYKINIATEKHKLVMGTAVSSDTLGDVFSVAGYIGMTSLAVTADEDIVYFDDGDGNCHYIRDGVLYRQSDRFYGRLQCYLPNRVGIVQINGYSITYSF